MFYFTSLHSCSKVEGSFLFLLILLMSSCARSPQYLIADRGNGAPDYATLDHWAAHPNKEDLADLVPEPLRNEIKSLDEIDVFFLHPTTYTGMPINSRWNAPLDDVKLNERTDNSTIHLQASIFNAAGQVYAPRYRQAHFKSFHALQEKEPQQALALAYDDIAASFEYYINHLNNGRPFIIAAHSQGSYHAIKLIKEEIDGRPLQKQLVAAYLIGMPVKKNQFDNIKACNNVDDTGCFVSWRTVRKGHVPKGYITGSNIVTHNPLSWNQNNTFIPKTESKGIVLRNFDKVFRNRVNAQVNNGLLWVNKPKFPWSFLFAKKNYHIVDYNFFYVDVRENAVARVLSYLGGARRNQYESE